MRRLLLPAILVVVAFAGGVYLDGPPPGHTGGFGEPTCHTCHFGSDMNLPNGSVELQGLGGVLDKGATYELTIVLRSSNLEAGGFQLAARSTDGVNAGSFESRDINTEVVSDTSTGVRYIQHTRLGAENNPVHDHSVSWRLQWTAPESSIDSVIFNIAANAANGDNSAFGDEIFTAEKIVEVE